jgi:hypothetical protein
MMIAVIKYQFKISPQMTAEPIQIFENYPSVSFDDVRYLAMTPWKSQ